MTDEHVEEELLQRYFDGELEDKPAAQVAEHVQACARCTARHRALSELRRAITATAEERARDVDFEALFGRIEQGVREQPKSGFGRLAARSGGQPGQRRRQFWMPAAGVLAAAAALMVFLRSAPQPQEVRSPGAVPEASALSGERPAPFVNSEVEQVDFGSNAGTVFEVALAEGVSTAVVWINDDAEQVEE